MKKIKIGTYYRDAFLSVIDLYNNGCINEGIITNVTDNEIYEADRVYIYDAKTESIDSGEAVIDDTGASWFKGVLGHKTNNDLSSWMNLLGRVSEGYHKNYSLIEFMQPKTNVPESIKKEYEGTIRNVLTSFYPKLKNGLTFDMSPSPSSVDVYGAFLKINITSGTGEAVPVLGKIYFTKSNNKLAPLKELAARAIDETIYKSILSDSNTIEQIGTDETNMIENVLDSIDSLIKETNRVDVHTFKDYLLITNEADLANIDYLVANGPTEIVKIECENIKVYSISHVRWFNTTYDIYFHDKKVFEFNFTLSGSLSIRCCNCDEMIMVDNYIKVSDEDIYLDCLSGNFGLDNNTLSKVLANNPFKEHLNQCLCTNLTRGVKACIKLICKKQSVYSGDEFKCINCPYPEIVYTLDNRERVLTRDLVFVRDKLDFVRIDEAQNCSMCKRPFTKNILEYGLCPLCNKLTKAIDKNDKEILDKAHENYKKYKELLPIELRLGKRDCYCFIDEDIIIIIVGKNKYLFNKFDLNKEGYIPSPKKI